jgi:hypothetical protein
MAVAKTVRRQSRSQHASARPWLLRPRTGLPGHGSGVMGTGRFWLRRLAGEPARSSRFDAITDAKYIERQDWKSALSKAKKTAGREQGVRVTPADPAAGLAGLNLDPQNQATDLVDLARKNFDLFRSGDGRGGVVERGGPNIAIQLGRKGRFATWLARSYIEMYGQAPGEQAVSDALRIISAYLDDDPQQVFSGMTRFAKFILAAVRLRERWPVSRKDWVTTHHPEETSHWHVSYHGIQPRRGNRSLRTDQF